MRVLLVRSAECRGVSARTYVHLLDHGLGNAAFLDEAVEAAQPLLS